MSARSKAARAARRSTEAPFDAWECRRIEPGLYARTLGFEPHPDVAAVTHAFVNARYSVQVSEVETEWGVVTHLWIRRHDAAPVRSWSDLQRIKDELAGSARVAVEVFPEREEVVDRANMYHLWVLPEGFRLPFTLKAADPEPAGPTISARVAKAAVDAGLKVLERGAADMLRTSSRRLPR